MEWIKSVHTKADIRNAGKLVVNNNLTQQERAAALKIVNDWRTDHAYPLHVLYMLTKRYTAKYKGAITARRLKRLESITGKLRRQKERGETMRLDAMQDIGGCRVITQNITQTRAIAAAFKNGRANHRLVREKDYITTPKTSGYRSIHLVYAYKAGKGSKMSGFDGLEIEVQIRTALQHAWATAIEVLSLHKGDNLKASEGNPRTLRYMELLAALFAIEEEQPTGDHVPQTGREIYDEMKTLEDANPLEVINMTKFVIGFTAGAERGRKSKAEQYYLFEIDTTTNLGRVYAYNVNQIEEADRQYKSLESDGNIMCVLVSTEGIDSLKKAYPNYFTDVTMFMKAAQQAISRYEIG